MGRIKIIGTSHISPESAKEIEGTIRKEMPDCIAVELDAGRLQGLLRKETISLRAVRYIGIRNFFVAKILSMIQGYLGRKTGMMPGEEMLTAVKMAREVRADLVLIDQDMQITLNRMRAIPFLEKAKIFFSIFKKSEPVEIDLKKVPLEKFVNKILEEIKNISPTLYKVLVEERDLHMARALLELSKRYDNIIAVVGIGHKRGILRNLGELKKEQNL